MHATKRLKQNLLIKYTEALFHVSVNGQVNIQAAQLALVLLMRDLGETYDTDPAETEPAEEVLKRVENLLHHYAPDVLESLTNGDLDTVDQVVSEALERLTETLRIATAERSRAAQHIKHLEGRIHECQTWIIDHTGDFYNLYANNDGDTIDVMLEIAGEMKRKLDTMADQISQIELIKETLAKHNAPQLAYVTSGTMTLPDAIDITLGNAAAKLTDNQTKLTELQRKHATLQQEAAKAQKVITGLRVWIATSDPQTAMQYADEQLGELAVKTICKQREAIADLQGKFSRLEESAV